MPNWQSKEPLHGTPQRLPQRTGQPPQNDFRVGEVRAAPVVALALSSVMSADRLLSAGTEIEFVDGGAKGNLTFRLKTTGVAPATYGAALKVPIIQIDDKGRIVSASEAALGTAAGLNSDNDVALAANSATRLPTQFAVKTYVDAAVTGVMTFRGDIDCSANPNYPAGTKGESYVVSVAGKIGGASGKSVEAGDLIVCRTTNAGGTEAAVGGSWFVLEHNLLGALLSANNLADLTNPATARTNLGLAIGTNVQAFDADLSALAALASNGMIVRTGAGTVSARTLTAPAAGIAVSNGDGVAGNPTLALADDLAALEALTGTNTIYFRSAANTWTAVVIGGNLSFIGGTLAVDRTLDDGEYTPTLTNVTNVAASTPQVTQWYRVGNRVTVFGYIAIDPTALGAFQVDMSLPVPSNFANVIQAGGTFSSTASGISQGGGIWSDATNDRVSFIGVATDTANRSYAFQFSYKVI